jgi:hypothetical protein
MVPVKLFCIKKCLNRHKEMLKIGKVGRALGQFGQIGVRKVFGERELHGELTAEAGQVLVPKCRVYVL